MSETQAPVAGADPRAWREMAEARVCPTCQGAREVRDGAYFVRCDGCDDTGSPEKAIRAALRAAAEAVTEAQAKATEYRGHLRYEVERRQELERAVAGLRAQIDATQAIDAAARGAEGERGEYDRGYRRAVALFGQRAEPSFASRLEALRGVHSWNELAQACLDVLRHGEEGTERLWGSSLMATGANVFAELAAHLAPRPSAGPVGGAVDPLADLVARFSVALLAKLRHAEGRHGWTNEWADPTRVPAQRADLLAHMEKGDPRDVAAYCAFLWHHGATCAPAARASDDPAREVEHG